MESAIKLASNFVADDLNLDLSEYKLSVIKDGEIVTGVCFCPYRMGKQTVFVSLKEKAPNPITGTYQQVFKELLKQGVDMDTAEPIPDERSIYQALKGRSGG